MKIEYEILFWMGWCLVVQQFKVNDFVFCFFTTKKGKNNVVITAKSGTVDCLG